MTERDMAEPLVINTAVESIMGGIKRPSDLLDSRN